MKPDLPVLLIAHQETPRIGGLERRRAAWSSLLLTYRHLVPVIPGPGWRQQPEPCELPEIQLVGELVRRSPVILTEARLIGLAYEAEAIATKYRRRLTSLTFQETSHGLDSLSLLETLEHARAHRILHITERPSYRRITETVITRGPNLHPAGDPEIRAIAALAARQVRTAAEAARIRLREELLAAL